MEPKAKIIMAARNNEQGGKEACGYQNKCMKKKNLRAMENVRKMIYRPKD